MELFMFSPYFNFYGHSSVSLCCTLYFSVLWALFYCGILLHLPRSSWRYGVAALTPPSLKDVHFTKQQGL